MKIPQLDIINSDLPIVVKNQNIEIGIAESYIAEPINTYIRQYEGKIRDTDTEKIDVTGLAFSFREGGFSVSGDVRVEFRKLLSEAPIVGAVYTPWVTVAGSFVEELAVEVSEGKLSVSHSQLYVSTNDGWYKKLFNDFVLPYLEKEVIKRINEQLSNFNGMTIEELVLKYGKARLNQKLGLDVLGEERVNKLVDLANIGSNRFERLRRIKNQLSSVSLHARVSEKHLWLSIKRQP